jgi:hypothetical protein
MKHLKKTFALLTLLTLINVSRTFAQDSFRFASAGEVMQQISAKERAIQRAKEVMQDNEYRSTGHERGTFLSNPLMLNGKPLDYGLFNVRSEGELSLAKVATKTGQTMQVPFYVYLRRNGNKISIGCKESPDSKQMKVDLSEVLRDAKPGDLLIIVPVNKEDGPAKRILAGPSSLLTGTIISRSPG